MKGIFPIALIENREIDGFDFIAILGFMKEYNRREIWRRYQSPDAGSDTISLYMAAERYFLEMHVQKMDRIILSEKFNTNPFFMQQVVQRITASHNHELIMNKIQGQGIDTGDNPICLSCSMGNTIIDLIVNKNDPFPPNGKQPHGRTHIETVEDRPLDVYDLSSTLYLCQQNLTEAIFRRYGSKEYGDGESPRCAGISARVGDYQVDLTFSCVCKAGERVIPPPGNASVHTIHQIVQRMNFRHDPALILRELAEVGLPVTLDQVRFEFSLRRYINNTDLEISFRKT